MINKWAIIIIATVCLAAGIVVGTNISSNQKYQPSNSALHYIPSYTSSYGYTNDNEDNEERISELEGKREEARDKIQNMRSKLEDTRDIAEENERKARMRYFDTSSDYDLKRKRDAEDQLENIEDSLDELDDMESELDD